MQGASGTDSGVGEIWQICGFGHETDRADPEKEKQVEVVHVGEPQFILTYEDPAGKSERMSWLKTAFVCLVTFFGTMFSIMTFNTDVDIPKLFERISSQFTSDPRGLAILEVTYSVGIGIGVVFSLIILENGRSPRIRHRWKWRCVRTRSR